MIKKKSVTRIVKRIVCLAVFAATSIPLASISQAVEDGHHKQHVTAEPAGLQLSHEVKIILNQEMNGIEEGMMKIIPAIAAGDWETIAKISQKIKDSFIMKQKLTQAQMEELHHALPAEFVAMDQDFHTTAGKLSHAAHQHDAELVNFYFYKLHSQCIKCHSSYAAERFPALKNLQQGEGHH